MACKGKRKKESRYMPRFSAWETWLIHICSLHYCLLPVLFTLVIYYIRYYLVLTSARVLTLKVYFLYHPIEFGTVLDTVQHSAQCWVYLIWINNKTVKERTTVKGKYRITKYVYMHVFPNLCCGPFPTSHIMVVYVTDLFRLHSLSADCISLTPITRA